LNEASEGRFSTTTRENLLRVDEIRAWRASLDVAEPSESELGELGRDERLTTVISDPRQIFAVGANYRHHAEEMGLAIPTEPMIFTKFASALAGQNAQVPVPSLFTDWEAELVVVVGRGGRNIALEQALDAVAGYCVGQDLSDRELQMKGVHAQFSMGKSWKNFAPVGPWLTTADEVPAPNNLAIRCDVSGVTYQDSSTSDMIFTVAEIVSYLSAHVELYPGDLIFTGSPHGVGQGLTPPRFLAAGDHVVTTIASLGTLYTDFVA
jgi:2-keto-4-pentenoate hydratase/2-oxohepta-3-ene-1,7-dioic acid hydratase in catechol pathway